jgi:hypothetical protein
MVVSQGAEFETYSSGKIHWERPNIDMKEAASSSGVLSVAWDEAREEV